jgi:hypothetical protein
LFVYSSVLQVSDDEEVMGWYAEVKAWGHLDKKAGWPVLRDSALLCDICVTLV